MANSELPTKQYLDRTITEQEKLHADLFQSFVAYTRRTGKQRDNADCIANILAACANSEKYDKTTKAALARVATILADVEVLRDGHVQNLEEHVLQELARFANQHRGSQTDLRKSFGQSQRQKKKIPSAAPAASFEPQPRHDQQFSKQLLDFETRRVSGLRSVLLNYTFSELAWHLKAAELCSSAYKALQAIDESEDVEEFRRSLQLPKEGQAPERVDRHRPHSSTLS